MKENIESFVPTSQQALLLRAALLDAPAALKAWTAWHLHADINRLDPGSFKLLPLLAHNLLRHGVSDPLLDRLKGVYRKTLYQNSLLLNRLGEIVEKLQGAGITVLLFKDTALGVVHYLEPGLRAMLALDILVPRRQIIPAIQTLSQLGWFTTSGPASTQPIRVRSFQTFQDSAQFKLNLHWQVVPDRSHQGHENDFFDAAVPTSLKGQRCLALNPADQLISVCLQAAQRSGIPNFHHLADAMVILKQPSPSLDWQRFIQLTRALHLTLPTKRVLSLLKKVLQAPVPLEILQCLEMIPVSISESLEYNNWSRPPQQHSLLYRIYHHYTRFTALNSDHPLISGYIPYLQQLWGVRYWWQLPAHVLSRLSRGI
jgi:hypothetical protein